MIRKTAGQLNITKQRQPQDLYFMVLRLLFYIVSPSREAFLLFPGGLLIQNAETRPKTEKTSNRSLYVIIRHSAIPVAAEDGSSPQNTSMTDNTDKTIWTAITSMISTIADFFTTVCNSILPLHKSRRPRRYPPIRYAAGKKK